MVGYKSNHDIKYLYNIGILITFIDEPTNLKQCRQVLPTVTRIISLFSN